jgi:uncharacterized repeat protein (TIGR02543 family)
MNRNKSIAANFIRQFSIALTSVNGTVTKSPNLSLYDSNTVDTLKASPNTGYVFIGWSGNASGSANPLLVTMNANKNITANFALPVDTLGAWNVGTTMTKKTGPNRALIVFVYGDSSKTAMQISSVKYGNQTLTKITEKNQGTSVYSYVGAFMLNEAGVNAATTSAISVTWSVAPKSGETNVASVFLKNVNQTTPLGTTATAGVSSATAISATALSTAIGDMAFEGAIATKNGVYTINNGFTRGIAEQSPSWGDFSTGYKAARGSSETPSVTLSLSAQQALAGFTIKR